MKLEHRTDIQAFYNFSNCCNDDLVFICKLLQFLKPKATSFIYKDLESLNVAKYENDFNFLLDNLQITTIKNLYSIYQLNQGATNEVINTVTI